MNGNLENPIGLMEKKTTKSFETKCEHIFVTMDFGKDTNYEIILGIPFAQQFRII